MGFRMADDAIQELLGYLVSNTQWYMRTLFNKLIKEAGVTVTPEQWGILKIVEYEPGIKQTEIARRGLKDKTNVTRMLDVLEKYGHIERRKDPNDRRAYRIYLTATGKAAMKKLFRVAENANAIAAADFSEPELRRLKEDLKRICETVAEEI